MYNFVFASLFFSLLLCSEALTFGQNTVRMKGMEWSIAIVSPSPLPYQAVRLRRTTKNVGEAMFETCDSSRAFSHLKRTGATEFSSLSNVGGGMLNPGVRIGWGEPPILRTLFRVDVGQWYCSSSAAAAEWSDRRKRRWEGVPFFTEPGKAEFGDKYHGARGGVDIIAPVDVLPPQGDDALIAESLEKDPYLAAAMMSTVLASDLDTVVVLTDIVTRYPKSSYANYARLALARFCVKGDGWRLYQPEALVHKTIDKLLDDPKNEKYREERLAGLLPCRHPARGKTLAIIQALIASRTDAEARAIETAKLMAIAWVSDEDRAACLHWLAQIEDKDFPYRHMALILKAKLHGYNASQWNPCPDKWPNRWNDPKEVAPIIAELDRDYADDADWICERTYTIRRPEEWQAFRVHSPTNKADEKTNE